MDPTSAARAAGSARIPPTNLSPESTFTESATRDQSPSRIILDTQAVRASFLSLRSEEIPSVTHEPRLKYSEKGFLDCKGPWLLG